MLRELYHQFLPYRSMAFPFLVASGIAVPCWLAFRLYLHRTRRRPPSFPREILLLIVVVYLAGLASATLTPTEALAHAPRVGVELSSRPTSHR